MSDLKKSTDALLPEHLGEVRYREVRFQEQHRQASRRYTLLSAVDALMKEKADVEDESIPDKWTVLADAAGTEGESPDADDAVLISKNAKIGKHTRRLPDLLFPLTSRKRPQE